jgi:AcrR family transcriptional regulator
MSPQQKHSRKLISKEATSRLSDHTKRTSLRKRGIDTLGSAEERIKEAAHILFTKNGFDAVKTRDIAKEAGINLALLNYYFRSKENLFEIVMHENMQEFFMAIMQIINDEATNLKKKIELLVDQYIEILLKNPELPVFVLLHMRNNPIRTELQGKLRESFLIKQVQSAIKNKEIAPINPVNIMLNLVGLTIFPFIGRPMLTNAHSMSDEQFKQLMIERKTLIPKWMDAILKIEK